MKTRAHSIIKENQYMALSTADSHGKPWTAVVTYAFDEQYNFYFVSLPDSQHGQHIHNSKKVTFAIFDSRAPFGDGIGLQMEGVVHQVSLLETPRIAAIYFGRTYPYGDEKKMDVKKYLEKLLQNKTYRFYKIQVTACWMNDPNADTDRRVTVTLI